MISVVFSLQKINYFTANSFLVFVNTIHLLRYLKKGISYFYQRCFTFEDEKTKESQAENVHSDSDIFDNSMYSDHSHIIFLATKVAHDTSRRPVSYNLLLLPHFQNTFPHSVILLLN